MKRILLLMIFMLPGCAMKIVSLPVYKDGCLVHSWEKKYESIVTEDDLEWITHDKKTFETIRKNAGLGQRKLGFTIFELQQTYRWEGYDLVPDRQWVVKATVHSLLTKEQAKNYRGNDCTIHFLHERYHSLGYEHEDID